MLVALTTKKLGADHTYDNFFFLHSIARVLTWLLSNAMLTILRL